MRQIGRNEDCPCGSGEKFKKCCGLILGGKTAPDAETLMRARYCAYVEGAVDYLWRTTHPDNPARQGVELQDFRRETLAWCRQVQFTQLTVHQSWPPDEAGVARVSFTARFVQAGSAHALHETSRFLHDGKGWLYHSGETDWS